VNLEVWDVTCTSQYDATHTRQDFTARDAFSKGHMSHETLYDVIGWYSDDLWPFCLRICSAISWAKEFSRSSGVSWKTAEHLGQWEEPDAVHWASIHDWQNVWPHGRDTGWVKTFRHTEHWNNSLDRKGVEDDITMVEEGRKTKWRHK